MFTHLHVHTSYSFLDGYCHIDKLVDRAKELGMTSLAITDHNHMGGIYEFKKVCDKKGIKPILGYEGYQTWDTKELARPIEERWSDAANIALQKGDITYEEAEAIILQKKGFKNIKKVKETASKYLYDTKQYHLILLAKNQTGLVNLIKLQSEAAKICTFNGRFLFDFKLLDKYKEGVICTTACLASMPAKAVNKMEKPELAEKIILKYKKIFGDDFYLELQPNTMEDQIRVNEFYVEMSKKHNIKLVATSDVHYVNKEDNKDHDILVMIGTRTNVNTPNRMGYDHNYWLKSEDELKEQFESICKLHSRDDMLEAYMEAMVNTQEIANKIESYELGSKTPLMPKIPGIENSKHELRKLAYQGLYTLAKKHSYIAKQMDKYEKRLEYELNIINYKDFADYMLIVREYIQWAANNHILVGPGRGSACSSLILWCIGITNNIDPIKYDLLFGRFLTIDRKGLPDIDSDFSYFGRDKVIEHIKDLYGEANVAHIGTYTQMGVKSGLKDVARALCYSFEKSNNLSKEIDAISDYVPPTPSFKDFDNLAHGNEQEKALYVKWQKLEKEHKEIFRLARNFEGLKRNFGIHASGILAMPCKVDDYFPTRFQDGIMVTLFDGVECEELGSAKLDVLGLKTLSIIEKTLEHLNKDINWLYETFDIEDPKLYKLLSQGKSDCVFQLESDMFKSMLTDMKPTVFGDIAAATSLGRPGPLNFGLDKQYIACKNGKADMSYPIHGIENILDPTYGVIAYQEQLMSVSKQVSGFDDNQADSITRKAIAKKKIEMITMMERCHIYGKKNYEGPAGWENDNNAPWYDPEAKYGPEIKGALANGYTLEEMRYYFKYISGFSSYAFNKSHAVAYSFTSMITTWLKLYYPVEFFASYLSMQDNDDLVKYVPIVRKEGIEIVAPNINISDIDFTPNGDTIVFGLGSIKGVGAASLDSIISNRPYLSLADFLNRIPKRESNKRVSYALIKAGAFDTLGNNNRNELIQEFCELRKNKAEDIYNPDNYNVDIAAQYEMETLNCPISQIPEWYNLEEGHVDNVKVILTEINERKDRMGNMMAFCKGDIGNGALIDIIIFSSTYVNNLSAFQLGQKIYISGSKESDLKLIAKQISLSK